MLTRGGKEAKLFYAGHALMENRNGLCVDLQVGSGLETGNQAAKDLLKRQARKRVQPTTLGGDKDYHTKDFVAYLRRKGVAPYIAQIEVRDAPAGWQCSRVHSGGFRT